MYLLRVLCDDKDILLKFAKYKDGKNNFTITNGFYRCVYIRISSISSIEYINSLLYLVKLNNGNFYFVDNRDIADLIENGGLSTIQNNRKLEVDYMDPYEFDNIVEKLISNLVKQKTGA